MAQLGDPAVSYTWSVVGRGAANYTPPANSAVWDVGDLKPIAGIHVFTFNEIEPTERWRQETLAVLLSGSA